MEEICRLKEPSLDNQKLHEPGAILKKKKERENWNSVISSDLIHDWNEKDNLVNVIIQIGAGYDKNSVKVTSEEQYLLVSLADGRKFQVNLFDKINPSLTIVSFSYTFVIVKLTKVEPKDWKTLEAPKKLLPEKPPRNKAVASLPLALPSDDTISEVNGVKETESNSSVIAVIKPKTNFCERTGDKNLAVFLYVKHINKENISVLFNEDKVILRFSTFDTKFRQSYPESDDYSVFEWVLRLKGTIIPEKCSFKLGSANIELKLKKANIALWSSLSSPASSPDAKVTKDVWVPDGETTTDVALEIHSSIPPAPPAPPHFHETRKVSNAKKIAAAAAAASSSTGSASSFHLPNVGLDSGSSATTSLGMSGLDNIGNTCFMNSVLQCLVNTRELRDYFVNNYYHQDVNKDNPLGMGGKLATCFANLMELQWKGNVRSHPPTKLKQIMSQKANQFSGYAQHDAQEFMVELLDGLHEDLNRIKKKPYIAEPPDLDGYSDHEAAEISWKLHKGRNDSIIDDLFKGQFKSTLQCHVCSKISVKFDEFGCLSVPIPKDQKTIQVIFFWREPSKGPKKFFIKLPADSSMEDLKFQLSCKTGVSQYAMQVIETDKSKIHKMFSRGVSLAQIAPSDVLMAFEVLDEQMLDESTVEMAVTQRMMIPSPPARCASCQRPPAPGGKLSRCTKCYKAGYCDTSCQKNHWQNHKNSCKLSPEPVGAPFIVSLPESQATFSNLSRIVEGYARYSVDIFQPPVAQTQNVRRRRKGSTSSGELSSEAEDMEVDSEGSNDGKDFEMENGGAYSGEDRAEADWPFYGASGGMHDQSTRTVPARRSSSISSNSSGDDIPQLSSSPSLKIAPPQRTLTPATALTLFTLTPLNNKTQNLATASGEALSEKDSEPLDLRGVRSLAMDWHTNEKRPVYCLVQNKEIDCEVDEVEDSIKTSKHTTIEACIDLFSQPENLSEGDLWRCPRCKKPVEATKQMSLWRLPTILILQLKRFSFKYVLCSDKIDKFVQYPVKGLNLESFMSRTPTDGSAQYDLFGVINHMGRLLGGHYTAYCRTIDPLDSQKSEIDWRLCDDSRVTFTGESRVVHDQAYLLLYRRRDAPFVIPTTPRPIDPEDQEEENSSSESDGSPEVPGGAAEPMDGAPTSMSLPSGSEPPSTVQEELD